VCPCIRVAGPKFPRSLCAASLDYRDLNEVPGLAQVNTTAEALADFCWGRLAPSLRDRGLDSLVVRIWESPDAYAAREAALD
jgi:6-pyruvoyltetrahydropterin/6-carboxytetrahydropterin synthase